ncbi:MAG: hypothetical protein BIFFINMI_01274 [Phycisphaerae bacterium]|nr:hypothetical protein [Phycisphaerae bacterium]
MGIHSVVNQQPPTPDVGAAPGPPGNDAPPPDCGDAADGSFSPILFDPPVREPRGRGFYLFVGCMVLGVLGLVVWVVKPAAGNAKDEAPELSPAQAQKMTARELVEDGGPMAAHELAVRMIQGEPADKAEATDAVRQWGSPRLVRNLAQQLALQQQKRQKEIMHQMADEQESAGVEADAP